MVKRDTARQILLMLVMFVISAGVTTIPAIFQTESPFVWQVLGVLAVVLIMTIFLRILLQLLQKLDAQEAADEKRKDNTVDDAMKKHTAAIVAALRENSNAIISAMREPRDGHE